MTDLRADEAEFRAWAQANGQVPDLDLPALPALRVVPLAEFVAEEEPLAETLLGEDGDAALTPGGTAMVVSLVSHPARARTEGRRRRPGCRFAGRDGVPKFQRRCGWASSSSRWP